MWVSSSIILIGAISLAWSLVVALDDDFNFIIEKEYKNKTTFLLKIVIISLLLLAIGISGRIYIHHNQINKIKAMIAEEYPDAFDFKIDKDRPLEGKFDYTLKDTFMGFHCGNTASKKLSFCEMKYQMIMARALPEEVTQGTLEGDIVPGDITFFRLQSTADCKLRAYIAQGEVLPVATRSFGSIGIFAIPEMGRFYRHVLIEKNFPHHGAVAFGKYGKALFEVFKYIGVPVEEIGYNQPKGVRYLTENPW